MPLLEGDQRFKAMPWRLLVRRGTAVAIDLLAGVIGGLALGLVVTRGIASAEPDLIPVGWWRVVFSLTVAAIWWVALGVCPVKCVGSGY